MGYTGTKIVGCNSPSVPSDKDTFSKIFDTTAQVLDLHDHTPGKGNQIPTGGIQDEAITGEKIAPGAVTGSKIQDDSIPTSKLQVSYALGDILDGFYNFTTKDVEHTIPNLSVNITSTGKPIEVGLISAPPTDTGQASFVRVRTQDVPGAFADLDLYFKEGTSILTSFRIRHQNLTFAADSGNLMPPGAFIAILDLPAGNHTIFVTSKLISADLIQGTFANCRLYAREL